MSDLPTAVENLQAIWNRKKVEMEFTQQEAAKDLGWSQGAISHYLNHVTELNPQAIIKFANFLDVDPREIDPEIESSLPSIQKIKVHYDSQDMTKRIANETILDRKQDSSIIVKMKGFAEFARAVNEKVADPLKEFSIGNYQPLLPNIYMKLIKVSEYARPKAYAARLKDSKKLHIFNPNELPPGDKIHTLWAVVSVTFY